MKIGQLVIIISAVILLGALFFFLRPKNVNNNNVPQESIQNQVQASPQSSPDTNIKTFELIVEQKELISGPETIAVKEGDEVKIIITADEPEELHLHGYDKSVAFEAEEEAELTFTANLTGRFVFELEESGTDLGALEVSPK